MTGVADVHHPLCEVDSSTGDVAVSINVRHARDGAGVNSHAHANLVIALQTGCQFHRTAHGRFDITKEDQSRSVTRGKNDQLIALTKTSVIAGAGDRIL